jgi:hypothetical protein
MNAGDDEALVTTYTPFFRYFYILFENLQKVHKFFCFRSTGKDSYKK